MKWILYILLMVYCGPLLAIEEVISLSVGLDDDFPLDPSFSSKKINFTGTYSGITNLVYDAKSNSIRFSPKKTGVATLHIKLGKAILKKYTISVRKTNLNKIAHEIKSLLSEIDGISIKIINNKVTVDGEILVPRDMKRIFNVIKEYPKQATSLVRLSTSAQNKVALFIEREIGNKNITVKAANEKFILRGEVAAQEEKNNAYIIAQLYAPSVITEAAVQKGIVRDRNVKNIIINLIKVKEPPKPEKKQNKLIQLVVHYVELDKNYDNQFKFQWAPRLSDGSNIGYSQSAVGSIAGVISGTISNFLPKLNWAKSFGFARILHSSNLVVEENKTGTVSTKQSIPYTTLNDEGTANTAFHKGAGIALNITPVIVGERQDGVRLHINFAVNSLVGSAQGLPITSEKNINTYIYVRSGLSAAIGGIITNSSRTGYNREPTGSGDAKSDPLINLLSSKSFDRSQNQFVVFVTPIIKSSASQGVDKIKRKFRLNQ